MVVALVLDIAEGGPSQSVQLQGILFTLRPSHHKNVYGADIQECQRDRRQRRNGKTGLKLPLVDRFHHTTPSTGSAGRLALTRLLAHANLVAHAGQNLPVGQHLECEEVVAKVGQAVPLACTAASHTTRGSNGGSVSKEGLRINARLHRVSREQPQHNGIMHEKRV